VKVIADYDYIYSVIDDDYTASGNGDYNYMRSYNQLQLNAIISIMLYIRINTLPHVWFSIGLQPLCLDTGQVLYIAMPIFTGQISYSVIRVSQYYYAYIAFEWLLLIWALY